MHTYGEIINAALTAPIGTQIRMRRHYNTDPTEGVPGALVSVYACPRMGATSIFILWDDEDRVAEYRIGRDLSMKTHWSQIEVVAGIYGRDEDPRLIEARIEVGERLAREYAMQRDALLGGRR